MCNQAHELGSRDRHPLARLQRYYHIDETGYKQHPTDQSNTMREFRQTQVRFCDADPSDDPRDTRSRRFYLWPGEEVKDLQRSRPIHKPKLDGRPVSGRKGLCCVEGTAEVRSRQVRYLEYRAEFWQQNGRLNPDPWLCFPGSCHRRIILLSSGKLLLVYQVCRMF